MRKPRRNNLTKHQSPARAKRTIRERRALGFVLCGYGFEGDKLVLSWEPALLLRMR